MTPESAGAPIASHADAERVAARSGGGNRFEQSRYWRIGLILGAVGVALGACEVAARVWVAWRWPAEKTYALTHHTGTRGRFTTDSILGYRGAPNFRDARGDFTHNAYGFRGPPFAIEKPPGTIRVAILGASTAYGAWVRDQETSAVQLEARLRALLPAHRVEVLNAGLPAWTSRETVLNLEHRVLPLNPDLIVIIDGRNEIFPQLFNAYRDDYSHYRVPGYDFRNSNYWHKVLFRASHLFMLLSAGEGGRLGFSGRDENPSYSSIRYENMPTHEQVIRNAEAGGRLVAYQRHLARAIGLARSRGVEVVLATMPFDVEKFGSGVLEGSPETRPVVARQVERNNDVVRSLARDSAVFLVESAALAARPDMLRDDCHFTPAGEQAFADLVVAAVQPWLRRVAPVRPGTAASR